jgi:hypothetical protein
MARSDMSVQQPPGHGPSSLDRDQSPLIMSTLANVPAFRPFSLALIQLKIVGSNKAENLKHARDLLLRAARDAPKKPDLLVLPVTFGILRQLRPPNEI